MPSTRPWPATPPQERAKVLTRVTRLIEERSADLLATITAEISVQQIIAMTLNQIPAVAALDAYAGLAKSFPWKEVRTGTFGTTGVSREPRGVVAAIIAWNVPLFLATNKIAPALLAGCTIVLKPSPLTPLTANKLAEICTEAGLPEGVLSVLPANPETAEYLVAHPGVDKLTFTGSTAVGKRIGAIATGQLKSVSLELGGKSAAILLADMDIAEGIPVLAFSGLMNSGQGCSHRRESSHRAAGTTQCWKPSRPPGRPGPRLVRRADNLRRRGQLLDHRAGGDLRPGALGDSL